MHKFFIGHAGRGQINADLTQAMFRQRHEVFHERLGWDVSSKDGLERDEFDDEKTVYVIAKDLVTQKVDASWRLRPTTSPYMLRDTFPQLLDGQKAPVESTVWEISRFAVVNTPYAGGISRMGELSQDLLAHTVDYAAQHGICKYVWVTGVSVERLGKKLGYRPRRLGPPQQIGSVLCIAEEISIDEHVKSIATQRLHHNQMLEAA